MRKPRLTPVEIDWSDPQHPQVGPWGRLDLARLRATAQQRMSQGLDLPRRWSQQPQHTLMLVGLGLGHALVAAWQLWRADLRRPQRLQALIMAPRPLTAEDWRRAHPPAWGDLLARSWPPLTSGWHRLALDGGNLTITVAMAPLTEQLSEWQAGVDSIVVDDHDECPEGLWPALARMANPGARLVGEPNRLTGCERHGFEPLTGDIGARVFTPRHQPRPPIGRRAVAPGARSAIVLGAGLAGAACARALHQQGLRVLVMDAAPHLAAGASGNPGGLFHGTVHADDGPHARWNRCAALHVRHALASAGLSWRLDGLMRWAPDEPWQRLQSLIDTLGLPADYVQALDAPAVHAATGLPLPGPAWFYPGGGALPPAELVAHQLRDLDVRLNSPVDTLAPTEAGWAVAHQGTEQARADLLVLATGAALPQLLAPWDPALARLLTPQRGQLSWLDPHQAARAAWPRQPVAAGGYALPLPDGRLLVGATSHDHDPEPACRPEDHEANAAHWRRLCGAPPGLTPTQGRVAWRLLAPDRLPIVGGLVDPNQAAPIRASQPSAWARRPGLLVCGALASRGITSSSLAGELAAALALGLPAPVERSLIDAVDPARYVARAWRHRQAEVSKP